ncbi:MAG TPA: Asd/ArgC dimerization domain-containing protein [Candidatus Acidoferrum sp.]|nr:Asd/ArgC dimerization domain-containing protein [Candidatus Acidoferrum sp.]
MPSFERDSNRIVIAGASSLLGAELKSLLEESRFAGWDLRLVDEEVAAGTLTEAGGEPAVIQPVEEGSFDRARYVFFAGSFEFTLANFQLAQNSGAVIIDLSGHSAAFANSFAWFPGLEKLRGRALPEKPTLASIPSAAAEAIVRLSLSLQDLGLRHLTSVVFQPVSAAGKRGVEELETQTSQLLSFESAGKPLFDAQVAFNILDRFGPASRVDLRQALAILRTDVHSCLRNTAVVPAIQLVHVPVFYGITFSACAELDPAVDAARIVSACEAGAFSILQPPETPSNVGVAGESVIQLGQAEGDPVKPGTWWFWGAADNIRLPAANAVKLAEKLAE